MLARALEHFSVWWMQRCIQRGQRWGKVIGRHNDPYLRRFYLAGTPKSWGLFLHNFVRSDAAEEGLHDHPFDWSISFVLVAGYWELRLVDRAKLPMSTIRRRVRPFTLNFIRGTDFHRVMLPRSLDGELQAWTLFLHGPRTKGWGFLNPDTGGFQKFVYEGDDAELNTY